MEFKILSAFFTVYLVLAVAVAQNPNGSSNSVVTSTVAPVPTTTTAAVPTTTATVPTTTTAAAVPTTTTAAAIPTTTTATVPTTTPAAVPTTTTAAAVPTTTTAAAVPTTTTAAAVPTTTTAAVPTTTPAAVPTTTTAAAVPTTTTAHSNETETTTAPPTTTTIPAPESFNDYVAASTKNLLGIHYMVQAIDNIEDRSSDFTYEIGSCGSRVKSDAAKVLNSVKRLESNANKVQKINKSVCKNGNYKESTDASKTPSAQCVKKMQEAMENFNAVIESTLVKVDKYFDNTKNSCASMALLKFSSTLSNFKAAIRECARLAKKVI